MVAPEFLPRAEAAFPGRNGRIVFTGSQVDVTGDGFGGIDFDLFTVSPSGHDLHRVTEDPEADDFYPAWSPDGRRIAFARIDPIGSSSAAGDIYVMDATGGRVTNLTASPMQNDISPSWSPDGTKIVFASDHSDPTPGYLQREADLYVMESDGRNVVQLTDYPGREWYPAWSPRGDVIAYAAGPSIRLIHPDGSDGRVVEHSGATFALSWSPDGRRITFESNNDIWVVNRDGSGVKNLTPIGGRQVTPAWSPDGKWIAFASDREGDYKLFKMRPDGSDVTRVVDITLPAEAFGIDWGPRP